MIDASKLHRVRTVENIFTQAREGEMPGAGPDQGTTVGDRELSTNPETVQPLKAALAYEVSRSLLTAEHTVLVEGPAEVLYFHWFNLRLASLGRTTLDNQWVVTPGGGIDKVGAFLILYAGKELGLAVVTNAASIKNSAAENTASDLRDSDLLQHGHVLTYDKYAGSPGNGEAEIEDVIGRKDYLDLTRMAFNLEPDLMRPMERSGISSASNVTAEVKEFMTSLPEGPGRFDRYRPAEFLIQQGADFSLPELDRALNRFESLFKDLNAMPH